MAVWNSSLVKAQKDLIDGAPPDPKRVKFGAYEMQVGDVAISGADGKGKHFKLEPSQPFRIPPGQFGVLLTKEIVKIPPEVIGRISVKFKHKRQGLANISGFHVDPGYEGRLKFWVQNCGVRDFIFEEGGTLFQLWLEDMPGEAKGYEATEDASRITPEDRACLNGNAITLSGLSTELRKNTIHSGVARTIGVGIIVSLLVNACAIFSKSSEEEAKNLAKATASYLKVLTEQHLAAAPPRTKSAPVDSKPATGNSLMESRTTMPNTSETEPPSTILHSGDVSKFQTAEPTTSQAGH